MLNNTLKEDLKTGQIRHFYGSEYNKKRLITSDFSHTNNSRYKQKAYNSRIKTQNFQQKSGVGMKTLTFKRASNSRIQDSKNMFPPDIYHKPCIRKSYFCQIIDAYIKQQHTGEKQVERKNTTVLNQKQYSYINQYKIQTKESQTKQLHNSHSNLQKKKRAVTASYIRREEQAQILQQKKQIKVSNQKQRFSKVSNDIFVQNYNNVPKVVEPRSIKISMFLKNKTIHKPSGLNSYLKSTHLNYNQSNSGLDNFSPTKKSKKLNPETDFNCSLSSQSQTHNIQSQVGDRLFQSKVHQLKTKVKRQLQPKTNKEGDKSRYAFSPSNTKSSSNRQSREANNSRSQSLFSFLIYNRSNKDIVKNQVKQEEKNKLQKQLNFRLKLVNSQFGMVNWTIEFIYKHELYTIYYAIGKYLKNNKFGSNIGIKNVKNTKKHQQKMNQRFRIKIKKFSQIPQGQKLKNTYQKIKAFETSQMWKMLPKNKLIDSGDQQILYYCEQAKPLRQELFKFIREQKCDNESSPLYKIHKTQSYYQLFHNNCEYFIDIITAVAKDLVKMKGRIINNKICLDNIYRIQEKQIKIADWGCSAVCRKIMVNNSQIQFKDEPSIKLQPREQKQEKNNLWLLSPENLPPEIIQLLLKDQYNLIWELGHCPEVWCLGIIIFQIITCIPVWMPYNAVVEHRIPKCGYFYDQYKRLSQIYGLQCKIPTIVSRWIRDEKNSQLYKQIHPEIIQLMKSMLQINTRLRPQPQQIIRRLSFHI